MKKSVMLHILDYHLLYEICGDSGEDRSITNVPGESQLVYDIPSGFIGMFAGVMARRIRKFLYHSVRLIIYSNPVF